MGIPIPWSPQPLGNQSSTIPNPCHPKPLAYLSLAIPNPMVSK